MVKIEIFLPMDGIMNMEVLLLMSENLKPLNILLQMENTYNLYFHKLIMILNTGTKKDGPGKLVRIFNIPYFGF